MIIGSALFFNENVKNLYKGKFVMTMIKQKKINQKS